METRLLHENEINEAKALWKTAFGDSDAFIDLYFANRILPGNSPAVFDDGKLVCILHLVPYRVDIRGALVDTAYVVGAATLPEYRKQGLMAALLRESLDILRQRGVAITHLYPFLHAFYEHFGWATYTQMGHYLVRAEKYYGYYFTELSDIAGAVRLYTLNMQPYTGYVVRDETVFSRRVAEFTCDGGKTACAYQNGVLQAYVLYEVQQDSIMAHEAAYLNQEALCALLEDAREKESARDIRISLPPRARLFNSIAKQNKPFGMARIADVSALLRLLPFSEGAFVMEIRDDFAGWNNGVFEAVYKNGRAFVERTQKPPQASCDILSFARLIHGDIGWNTLVREGKATVHDKNMNKILNSLFSRKNTFVYEAY